MKRDRSISPPPPSAASTTAPPASSSDPASISSPATDMACPHLTAAFSQLAVPRPSQQVHREECTLCFDDQDMAAGVDVCLFCFNGACPAAAATGAEARPQGASSIPSSGHAHSRLHAEKTGHALVLNVKRRRKPQAQRPDEEPVPKKLAIAAETEEDKYELTMTPKCLLCDAEHGGKELPRTEKLEEVIGGVMRALSSAQQSEVKAWEEEITACEHTLCLEQHGEPKRLEADGVGGNSHGLSHFEATGHPVSVKQGTITAEGTADIYCYQCNDARLDPELATHLKHFGINVMNLSKTEKSMTELQIEQNLKFDFNMTGEDGKELEPLYGPGRTGLRNLGNSCYMASVLQTLFSFPAFQSRYLESYLTHIQQCPKAPADCLECQTAKVADGLLSGRYAVPRSADEAQSATGTHDQGPAFQLGIRPSMFKALIGKGHAEFATMRQQDADEFLKHLLTNLQAENKRLGITPGDEIGDATRIFAFALEERLQCTECKRVRYKVHNEDSGISVPVPLRPKPQAEGESDPSKVEYEPVELSECLDLFTAPTDLEYNCSACKKKVAATQQTLFHTFPRVLAVQARRFQLVNWVPQKVNVPVVVPLEQLQLDKYMGKGKQDGEEELPDDGQEQGGGAATGPSFNEEALASLISFGFPEIRGKRALLATGNSANPEIALNWLMEHMEDPDIDDPLPENDGGTSAATAGPDTSALEDMGFSKAQATKALRLNGNNAEMAVAWLFENPDDPGEEPGAVAAEAASSGDCGSGSGKITGSKDLPATYQLKSFVSHKGPSVHSGHYVAHIRNPGPVGHVAGSDDDWVLFNDEKVVKAPLSSAAKDDIESDVGVKGLSKLAYVYFYQRQD
ncbi:ubiquitin C-terminal hydrolase Ubp14 [Tilletia horrida]|uniref:Ubiquitin carboxyl-terminal hydrolase n=1 Tax=Tilletia horrida TaxID=155126 RepID=A0AAN6GFG3_9BASI|nr:ubiquitin C-terminal hydrolase Ubp14 [Tilletia horrida]